MDKTGVVIVTFNAMNWVNLICETFKDIQCDIQLYIVDNNSSDGTIKSLRKNLNHAVIIELNKNAGFGYANNVGLKHALADNCNYFLLLNQDAAINIDSIRKLRSIHSLNKDVAILSPVHLYSNSQVDRLHLCTLTRGSKKLVNDLIINSTIESVYEIPYTNAAIWHMAKEGLVKIGGFDPLFVHYGEDVDYCRRVYSCGMRVGFTLKVRGYHLRNQESEGYKRNSQFYYNSYLLTLKETNRSLIYQYINVTVQMIKDLVKQLLIPNATIKGRLKPLFSYFKLLLLWKEVKHSRDIIIIDLHQF